MANEIENEDTKTNGRSNDNASTGDDDMKNDNNDVFRIIDVGMGWGSYGYFMNTDKRNYKNEINKLGEFEIYGYDFSKEMINISKLNGFNKYYKSMIELDIKKKSIPLNDGTINIIISNNCLMMDKKLGNPNENFLIEISRLLKIGGYAIFTKRFIGSHPGYHELIPYLLFGDELGWKHIKAARIRDTYYLIWKKIKSTSNFGL